jgi:hypothetical protein
MDFVARIFLKSVPVVGVLALMTYALVLNYGRDSFSQGIDICFQQCVLSIMIMLTVVL